MFYDVEPACGERDKTSVKCMCVRRACMPSACVCPDLSGQ